MGSGVAELGEMGDLNDLLIRELDRIKVLYQFRVTRTARLMIPTHLAAHPGMLSRSSREWKPISIVVRYIFVPGVG